MSAKREPVVAVHFSRISRFHPHSCCRTLIQIGERVSRAPEEFKAWSQNLGHENVLTTFTSYGEVSSHRQAKILNEVHSSEEQLDVGDEVPDAATVAKVLKHLSFQNG